MTPGFTCQKLGRDLAPGDVIVAMDGRVFWLVIGFVPIPGAQISYRRAIILFKRLDELSISTKDWYRVL